MLRSWPLIGQLRSLIMAGGGDFLAEGFWSLICCGCHGDVKTLLEYQIRTFKLS